MATLLLTLVLLQSSPLAEARLYAERGDVPRAIALLSDARAKEPTPALLALLAELQAGADQIPQAAESLVAALELAPEQTRLRVTLGAMYYRLGRLTEAQSELERALSAAGENPIAHYYMGAVSRSSGQLDAASRHIDRALELLPENAPFAPNDFSPRTNALYLRAELDFERGEHEGAERTLKDVLAKERAHAGAHYLLAQVLLRTSRSSEAKRELELFRVTKQAQEHLELGLNYARHAGAYDTALAELEAALDLFPDHPRAMYFLAFELYRAGRTAEAAATLERLVELRPDATKLVEPLLTQLR